MSDLTLSDAQLDAIAERVVDRLRAAEDRPAPERLLDAAEAAKRLGVSRDYVYAHAADLGAVRIGGGKKPRLRFAVAEIDRACLSSRRTQPAASPAPTRKTSRRRSQSLGTNDALLPIRGSLNA